MIQEQYVSFETAKLLKDKGFMGDECHAFYTEDGKIFYYQHYHDFDRRYVTDAPTQQMAMRWLREKHKLHCSVVLKDVTKDTYVYSIADLGDDRHWIRGEYLEYPSYEEACESAIKYCLENLIK